MSHNEDLTSFLSRADRLATVFDIERALADWNKAPRPEMEPSVKQILEDTDNLSVARDLVKQLDEVKKRLLDQFGLALESELLERVGKSTLTDGWDLHGVGERPWSRQWASLRLVPQRELNRSEVPYLFILVQNGNDKINCGICRSYMKKDHPDWEIVELKDFETRLRSLGYHISIWWLGFDRLYFLDKDAFFLKASGEIEKLVGEVADTFMNLFEEHKEQLEMTNRALVSSVTQ